MEAELGHVGLGDEYRSFGSRKIGFTKPDTVEYFVKETGVDFLAIAFGNAHGVYKGEPDLDLKLVADIRKNVEVPLVMHGGTGISDNQFQEAIKAGISKVNYFTNISISAVEKMRAAAEKSQATMLEVHQGTHDSYYQWGKRLYEVFHTSGKV